jgi:NADPH:quinone reductase
LPSIQDLFAYVASGELKLTIGGIYPIEKAAAVHEEMNARQTKGKLILQVK